MATTKHRSDAIRDREVHFRKIGSSVGMVLPKDMVEKLHVKPGMIAHVAVVEGAYVLTPKQVQRTPPRRALSWYFDRAEKRGLGAPVIDEIFPESAPRGGEIL